MIAQYTQAGLVSENNYFDTTVSAGITGLTGNNYSYGDTYRSGDNAGIYSGYVYAWKTSNPPRTGSAMIQIWAKVTNINTLGWVGDAAVNGVWHGTFGLLPTRSHWVPGPATITSNRKVYYTFRIDPVSDASVIRIQIYAPYCS